MPRWVAVCGDCWAEEFPGDYFPDSIEFETCGICGQDALCAHVRPTQLPVIEDRLIVTPQED